ncbi:MAG: Mfa1 family fimbria major subunit, partial [Dysgonamonadaceae bacterium]|nr:Mfa1 family fimbria major subunit [Dysgonamonadaceae bacterium]
ATTQTRANNDANATDEEATVKTVDVYLYTGTGAYLSHESLTATDFAQVTPGTSEEKYEAKTKIKTTTGPKNIFVGINLPAALASSLENKPMNDLFTDDKVFTKAELTTPINGLPMFSKQTVSQVLVEDDTKNDVSIPVHRMVAKVTVEKSASMTQGGVPGTLGELQFAINNFNSKSFLVQGIAPDIKDPNWDTYDVADFIPAETADYATVLDRATTATPTISQYVARYASENTSKDKKKLEITRVTVRTTFIPDNITVSDGAGGFKSSTATAEGILAPQTFYTVLEPTTFSTLYFYDKTLAEAYAATKGLTADKVIEYPDGYCYWDMFLNKNSTANKWDVVRNDFYKCSITRIVAPGHATPEVSNPDESPDTETNISVNIEVSFWNTPVLADYELEP